jgi:uncharacterized protein YcbK (DUF882 family)
MAIKYSENVKKEFLNTKLLRKLELLELYCDIDLIVTSGHRTPKENEKVGGAKDSSHLKGLAVDILCLDGVKYEKIRKSAEWAGITRKGHGSRHIHLDIDPSKPQNCEWWEK